MRSLPLFQISITAAVAAAACAKAQPPTVGAFVDADGITRIYGNSFGRPGYHATYDYIIVGGGNAGNTIAARLAEDPANYTVAVIEAGSFYEILDGNRTQVPGYNYINTITFPLGDETPLTSWGLTTEPQAAIGGRTAEYGQGQTFGGSTASNYMGYHRATVGTFDQWAELLDDDFWTWDNVYPAYKQSVAFQPPDYTKIDPSFNISYDATAFIPTGGPLHVSYGNHQGAYGPSLSDALAASGLDPIDGFNSGRLIGYGTATATIDTRTATRDSSETSFLQAAARAGIKIYPQAVVTRILFDEDKKATGVEVQTNVATGQLKYSLSATKEVILSAGVWHSPQLLMVSGVGPAETLQEHGIEVISDLPGVGQNEWDQPVIGLFLNLSVETNTQFQVGNPEVVAAAMTNYLENQSGPLSGFGTGQGIAFENFPESVRSDFSNSTLAYLETFPEDWPEVEYLPLANVPVGEIPITPYDNFILLAAVLLSTESKGNMSITSSSVFDRPIINPNWLATDADMEQAYAAFLRLREISSNWDTATGELLPGLGVSSKEDILDFIRGHSGFIFHGTSTCKMGPQDDPSAVIDSRARVYGVTGLRVVDASAFPNCPPGHPMASVYMYAEKIAESILDGN
ncbi:alcohol oxidase [Sodiomyces alkalinus F11]|uniref:Alcohol oxidase n=1 Tax=Sodiomyces alkalinus (strain CBS 110278 / VKM F-3762 / F11) TaxID=1314773 RepID=A0A3N2Q349_SODAK|nr:alcohol oxidase [Sodiomyces alkalinus F11]ROT41098.1 alcohol oxidase [Sodiomyces alkalinus F11]